MLGAAVSASEVSQMQNDRVTKANTKRTLMKLRSA